MIRFHSWGAFKHDCRDIYHVVRCWIFRPYTTIKPRHLQHTWTDKDSILCHMMMEILQQFIEKECSPGMVSWYNDHEKVEIRGKSEYVMDIWKEIITWWEDKYVPYWNGTDKEYNDMLDKLDYTKVLSYEQSMENQLGEYLKLIVDLRARMWT